MKTLIDLKPGEEGIIEGFKEKTLACSLLTLGVLPETTVRVLRKSPMGNAIYLKLGDYFIAMRKSHASHIIIRSVNE